jgi:hypothetical protein
LNAGAGFRRIIVYHHLRVLSRSLWILARNDQEAFDFRVFKKKQTWKKRELTPNAAKHRNAGRRLRRAIDTAQDL